MTDDGAGLATVPSFLAGDADGDGLVGSGDLDIIRVATGDWRLPPAIGAKAT